jgi:endonuclease/exonuclease/phosphatase family metal-dependent hydrolase
MVKITFFILVSFLSLTLYSQEFVPHCHYNYVLLDKPRLKFNELKELKIMTYNTLNLEESVGRYIDTPQGRVFIPEKVSKPEWQQKKIAEIIKTEEPDFLFLQEIEGFEAINQFSNQYLENNYYIFQVKGNDTRGIDNVILMNKKLPFQVEMYSFRQNKIIDPNNPSLETAAFSRDFPVLIVRNTEAAANSEPVLILGGVHLKSQRDRGSDIGSKLLREKQVEETMKILKKYREQYPNTPIIIGGDFNADLLTKPEFASLTSDANFQMTDAFNLLNKQMSGLERTTHTFHPRGGATVYSQLDAIMVNKINVKEAKIIRYKDGPIQEQLPQTYQERELNPSDHFPIVVKLEFQ